MSGQSWLGLWERLSVNTTSAKSSPFPADCLDAFRHLRTGAHLVLGHEPSATCGLSVICMSSLCLLWISAGPD
jgi:hypothetical protein